MAPRALALILATAAVATTAEPAAASLGAPTELRRAVPGDMVSRPDAAQEWWRLTLTDPRNGSWVELQTVAEGVNWVGATVTVGDADGVIVDSRPDIGPPRADARGIVAQARGSLRLALDGRAATLELTDADATMRLRLRGATRGPAAFGWTVPFCCTIGDVARWSWTVPIASARVTGSLTIRDGAPIDLDGYRATLEHSWGGFEMHEAAWNLWDQYVLHARDGTTWLLHGMNRNDTLTGLGARDAQWNGVLARVDRRGLRMCRPGIHRARWTSTQWLEYTPGAVRARCGGLRLKAIDGGGPAGGSDHISAIRSARTPGGVHGIVRHISQGFNRL